MLLDDSRRLCRRIDRRILPILAILYFFAFISRSNIANIHTHLVDNLRLSESQFGWTVTVFFFGYTFLQIPSNLCLQRFTAPRWLAFLAFSWGLISMLMALSQSFQDLMIYRALLGACEAGIFPGCILYLTFWYRPEERGLRVGTFFSASIFASAVAGLLGFGLLKLDGVWGLRGWQWLLIVEGMPSLLAAILCYSLLPASPDRCAWLTPEERLLARRRLLINNTTNAAVSSEDFIAENYFAGHDDGGCDDDYGDDRRDEVDEELDVEDQQLLISNNNPPSAGPPSIFANNNSEIPAIFRALRNPLLWLLGVLYLLLVCPFMALNTFLPKIIELFGFDPVLANLITAPIYLTNTLTTLIIMRQSDRAIKQRPWYLIACCVLICTGLIGVVAFTPGTGWLQLESSAGDDALSLALPLIFSQIALTGAAPVIPLSATWLTQILPRHDPDLLSVGMAMMTSFGQVSGWLVPLLYTLTSNQSSPSNDSSILNYNFAHLLMALSSLLAACLVLCIRSSGKCTLTTK